MKKILSLMVCLTLVICSSIMFAACGNKKDPPKATFTVADDVVAKATAIVDELQTKVYNANALETDKNYTYAGVQEKVEGLTEGYFVEVGKLANLKDVNSITIGGIEYAKTSTFKLSVGNNNFIQEQVYTIDNEGNVKIAGPVVAFELKNASSKIKFNDKEFDLLKDGTAAEELNFKDGEFVNVKMNNDHPDDGIVTNVATKTSKNNYDLQLNSSDDAFVLGLPDGFSKDGKFLIRSVVDGKVEEFVITGVDEGKEENKGLGMFFGRKDDNTVDPAIDGKTKTYDVYYTEGTGANAKSGATTINFNLKVVEFAVENNIAAEAKASIDKLNEKVYNKIEGGDAGKEIGFDAIKNEQGLNEFDGKYYIPVGKFKTEVNSIEVEGNEYTSEDDFTLSIGRNTRIKGKAFKYEAETKTLSIASPIIAFRSLEKIKVNDVEYDFLQANQVGTLELTKGKALGTETKNKIEKTNDVFTLELRNTREAFAFTPETELTDGQGYFLTRTGKNFGLTGVEDGGYSSYFGFNDTGIPDKKLYGERTIGLYYVNGEEIKSADLVLDIKVIQGSAQLQALVDSAEKWYTVALPCDFDLTETVTISKTVQLNLNDKHITESFAQASKMFKIVKNGNLIIRGKGEIVTDDCNIFQVYNEDKADTDARLTIENGTYTIGNVGGDHCVVQLVYGQAVVEGGTFKISDGNSYFLFNGIDAGTAERQETAKVTVRGGKYYLGTGRKLVLSTDKTLTDAVLEYGLTTEETDDGAVKVVAQSGTIEVKSSEELIGAIKNAKTDSTIKLMQSFELKQGIKINRNVHLTLDLNDFTITDNITDSQVKTMFDISSNGKLTVVDNGAQHKGAITSTTRIVFWLDAAIKKGATLTIEGGSFCSNIECVYVTGGVATINDGSFKCVNSRKDLLLNIRNNAEDAAESEIIVNGGEFKEFKVEETNSGDEGIKLGAGKKVEQATGHDNDGNWWRVVDDDQD